MVSYVRYWLVSALAASAVLYHAFATRQHFYPTALYLSTSKLAVAVVGNLAFATALLLHKALIKIFLGSLRDIEQELIRERLSSAIMESLLALTIFREEFSGFFVAMFAGLVFVKVLHWLVQDRVDYIEATPNVSRLQHLRIVIFMTVLLAIDALFLNFTVTASIQSGGQSVMLLFAFEYVIQASDVVRYFIKYSMSMLDLVLEGRWEGKGTCVFYLDLITDLLHLFVYVIFFVIVFTNYGLPLHLVRDLYSTFRNFRNRILDFLRFRQVSARLDRLPDAGAEDLARSDGVCIICREEMAATGSNKKLMCGHLFHTHCLRSWMERQQNCPTCRAPVFQRRQDAGSTAARRAAANAGLAAAGAAAAAPGAGQQAADAAAGGAGAVDAAGAGQQAGAHAHHPARHHGVHVAAQPRIRLLAHRQHRQGAPQAPAGTAPASSSSTAAGVGAAEPLLDHQHQVPWTLLGPQIHALNLGLGMPGMLPTMPAYPTLLPPLMPAPGPNNVLEQQAAAAAAAAALAAAAAVGAYNPLGGFMFMPPLVPSGTGLSRSTTQAATGAAEGSAQGAVAAAAGNSVEGNTAAAGSHSRSEAGGSEEEPSAAVARLTGELNNVLQQLMQAKQQVLARQVAQEMQACTAAATAAAASASVSAAGTTNQPTASSQPAAAGTSQASTSQAAVPAAALNTHAAATPSPPAPLDELPKPTTDTSSVQQPDVPVQPTNDAQLTEPHSISTSVAAQQESSSGPTPATAGAGSSSSSSALEGSNNVPNGASGTQPVNGDDDMDEVRRKRLARFQ